LLTVVLGQGLGSRSRRHIKTTLLPAVSATSNARNYLKESLKRGSTCERLVIDVGNSLAGLRLSRSLTVCAPITQSRPTYSSQQS
jgi:hypothetical protein